MDIKEFQEMVQAIRASFDYTYSGLSTQEVESLNQRLDSDSYKAANAVLEFFERKRIADA
jgi:hypothetical protein